MKTFLPGATDLLPDQPATQAKRRILRPVQSTGDKVFRVVIIVGGMSVMAITTAVGLFLLGKALSALKVAKFSFLTTQVWQPDIHHFGIATALVGTILIGAVAMSVSFPLALGTALFISEVCPLSLRRWLIAMVDLMAAVPSVVYGLWGLRYLQGHTIGVARWLASWGAWFPPLKVLGFDPSNPLSTPTLFTASTFVAGIVVGLMVMPIQCSLMREGFTQAPQGEREGAYALGATRWGMITSVVLPFGRGSIIGGTMLGFGRALGETIAVLLIISPATHIQWHILMKGALSISFLIANDYGEASSFGLAALMAAGFVLFMFVMAVNFGAAQIIARSRSGDDN